MPMRTGILFPLLLACSPSDVERGDRLAREHRFTEAVDAYKAAIARYPHDYEAAWGIARLYCLEVHFPDKCLAWTEPLLAAYPHRGDFRRAAAQGWRDTAREAAARGDGAKAAAATERAAAFER